MESSARRGLTPATARACAKAARVACHWRGGIKQLGARQCGCRLITESVTFSPDGLLIASGGVDRTVRLWDVQTGEEIWRLSPYTFDVYSVAFSSDGRWIASGGADRTVRLWDVQTGKQIRRLEAHTGFVYTVAFSPNGRWIASGSSKGELFFWSAANQ